MFWIFGSEACGTLAPWPGIKSTPPALEGKVSTTGPPGKSPNGSSDTEKVRYKSLSENLPQLSVLQPAWAGSGEWLPALKAAGKAGLAAVNPPILH